MSDEEISCIVCGRIYKTQIGFQKHKCKPTIEAVTKRKLNEKEQLYHDIISDRKYEKLDGMKERELDEFIKLLVEQEPGIVSVDPNAKKKNVNNLYLTAYNEARRRVKWTTN